MLPNIKDESNQLLAKKITGTTKSQLCQKSFGSFFSVKSLHRIIRRYCFSIQSEFQDGSEILCSGTLTLSKARPPEMGPIIRWIQDPQNPADGVAGSEESCGSLPGEILFLLFFSVGLI